MLILRIFSLIFIIPGFATVFAARWAVNRFGLDKKVKPPDFEHEMNEDEIKQYNLNKAVVNFKMLGLLVALPGLIMFMIAFR